MQYPSNVGAASSVLLPAFGLFAQAAPPLVQLDEEERSAKPAAATIPHPLQQGADAGEALAYPFTPPRAGASGAAVPSSLQSVETSAPSAVAAASPAPAQAAPAALAFSESPLRPTAAAEPRATTTPRVTQTISSSPLPTPVVAAAPAAAPATARTPVTAASPAASVAAVPVDISAIRELLAAGDVRAAVVKLNEAVAVVARSHAAAGRGAPNATAASARTKSDLDRLADIGILLYTKRDTQGSLAVFESALRGAGVRVAVAADADAAEEADVSPEEIARRRVRLLLGLLYTVRWGARSCGRDRASSATLCTLCDSTAPTTSSSPPRSRPRFPQTRRY